MGRLADMAGGFILALSVRMVQGLGNEQER
jgi:hypothetical protein